jgi:pimeloyl-ACP methyl ester carboxylesterase
MITGGPGDDWKLTPFVKVYDNFRNTFLNNEDYALGENYFEFYYDWRQPLGELTDDLDNFLNDTVLIGKPENTKANLVGHSMGGLLATAYSNEYGLDKVNQVVTVGSPHQGAIPAWTVWSGAEQTEKWSWEWLGLQLYLQLQKGKFASPVDAVHNLTPGMNNLLPIFDFAKDSSDQVIPVGSMSAVNYYLADLQTNLTAAFKNILATFAGKEDNLDHDTIEWIKLSDRSLADQLLNKWPDGKPDSYEYTEDGDLTVLQNSALVLGASSSGIINASHNYLLENQLGIQAVLDALGLTELSPSTDFTSPPRSPALVFLLHSPAQIMVMLPGGSQAGYGIGSPAGNVFYSEEDKLLIIYDAQNGDYHIEVIGIDEGSYELEIGQLTETDDVWTTIAGETALDQVDEYAIDFTSEDPDYQPLIDEIGQTQLNMAKIILMQIEEQIIQLDLPEIKEVELLDYLGSLQNFIAKASTKIDEGNFKLAQRYLRTIMKGVYSLRQKLDKVSLEDEARFELKAKAHQAGLLLIDAYVNTLNQSGIILKPKAVNTHLKNTQKVIDRVTKKLAKIEGENVWAGEAYQLSLTMLLKANEANDDGNLPEAVAKSIVSRILALEASKLIN